MEKQKTGKMGFHHIALRVNDYDKSVAFYTDGLGFKPRLSWGEGDGRIVLLDIGDGGCVEIFAGGKDEPQGAFWHFAFSSEDPDAAYEAALKAGAESHREPFDTVLKGPDGEIPARIAFVKGPDGELLEFFKEI